MASAVDALIRNMLLPKQARDCADWPNVLAALCVSQHQSRWRKAHPISSAIASAAEMVFPTFIAGLGVAVLTTPVALAIATAILYAIQAPAITPHT